VPEAARTLEARIARALAAEENGQLEAAAEEWAAVRRESPEDPRGYAQGARVLRALGDLPAAAAALDLGITRCGNVADLAAERATIAYDLGDLQGALAGWQTLRRRFPSNPAGYVGGGLTLRRLAAFEEAEAIYRAGVERFPQDIELLTGFAMTAEERGDSIEAARRWREAGERRPDAAEIVVQHTLCLLDAGRTADAERVAVEALRRFPHDAAVLETYAWMAHRRRAWAEALKRWDPLLTRYPELATPRRYAAEALLELGRPAEAAAVLAPALRLYPEDADIAILEAWIVTRSGDAATAAERWRELRARLPERVDGYLGGAQVARDAGRLDEADALLQAAAERFPDDARIAVDSARVAALGQREPEAQERWHSVVERFPAVLDGYVGLGESLTQARQFAAALKIVAAGLERFPESLALLATHAHCLRKSGQLSAAKAALELALERFPDDLPLGVEKAFTLSELRDWPAALALWEALKRRHPQHEGLAANITAILGQALEDQAINAGAFTIPRLLLDSAHVDIEPTEDRAALLKGFESLGDSCEFGMVQRLHRVEQMGLLRWAETAPDALVAALESRFEGVGDPEHTEVTIVGGEYRTADRRYGMRSHTFTSAAVEPLEEFAPEQCRRIQWLRRKLLDTLSTGAKILVYTAKHGITDAQAGALLAALRRYSAKNRLLCVSVERPGRPAGTVVTPREGLYLGYIDRLSTVDVSVDVWLKICRQVAKRGGA
jgi:tetratricopeptide (TPR) repeat protein